MAGQAAVQDTDQPFCWVKGHSGDPMNGLVDQLAVQAARTQRGEQGIARTAYAPT
jgi:ribonuclease HI